MVGSELMVFFWWLRRDNPDFFGSFLVSFVTRRRTYLTLQIHVIPIK
jgi:hypothetical protein